MQPMTERQIAEVLRGVPTVCGNLHHPGACRETGCVETGKLGEPDYDAMARAVVEQLVSLGWVNLADPAVCHGGHAACVHVIEDMKVRDARLARLGEALKAMVTCLDDQVFVRNITNDDHFPSYVAQASRIVAVLKAAQDALADAGAGKERGDG